MKNIFVRFINDKGQRKTGQFWKADAEVAAYLATLDFGKIVEIKISACVVPVLPTQQEAEARGQKDK